MTRDVTAQLMRRCADRAQDNLARSSQIWAHRLGRVPKKRSEMSSDTLIYWALTLAMGLVIVVAVIILLGFLVALVKTIDNRVVDVRNYLRAITGNTASTSLIADTADGVDAVLAEGLQHHLFLTRAAAGTPVSANTGK